MATTIRIPDVRERDVDLFLLEEFVASSDFQSWFLTANGLDAAASHVEAGRSINTLTGESDLELTFQGSSGTIKVLIENKVDAAFQPNQPQRYAERAAVYENSGKYREVITVLMAPECYFGDEDDNYGFDAKIAYEDVLKWVATPARAGPRTDYKVALLRAAIERGRAGWQLVPHPTVGAFWRSYWQLADRVARHLSMPVPKNEIPAGSHFIVFRPLALPADVKLKHKVGYGHVDLEFRGMGDRLADMLRLYGEALPTGARIEKAAKSAVVRIRVEPIDVTKADFTTTEALARKGIETAALLLDWYMKVHPSTKTGAQT
jgi:hypothetical protein